MSSADLRPLGLGELLDRTFTLYRNHFWLFVGIMAVPQLLAVGMSLLLQALMGPVSLFPAANTPPPTPVELGRFMGRFFLGFLVIGVVHFVLYAVALGATTFAVSEIYLGRPATIRTAYRGMQGNFWRLLGLILLILLVVISTYFITAMAGILAGTLLALIMGPLAVVGILLGALAGIAFSIWVALLFGVSVPALLLEKIKIFQAMTRSAILTRGHRGRVFLILLLMVTITYAVLAVFQGPFIAAMLLAKGNQMPLWLRSLSAISGGAGNALSGPLLMIALSLLYYDVRVRREAFDLQVMMAALEPSGPAPSPGTSGPPAVTGV